MSPREDGRSGSPGVLLSADCRSLRRALRPVVWVVLEEIALNAVLEDDWLVARTSARQVAERLGMNPTTAAEALRVLARRGLVSLEREKGPGGRFGLSAYHLRPPAGIAVVRPGLAEPHAATSSMVQPDTAKAEMPSPRVDGPHMESSRLEVSVPSRPGIPVVRSDTASTSAAADRDGSGATAVRSPRQRNRSTVSPGSSRHCPGQTALDLELGSS
jgi:DNA-binding transcriptional ArsR family regulator